MALFCFMCGRRRFDGVYAKIIGTALDRRCPGGFDIRALPMCQEADAAEVAARKKYATVACYITPQLEDTFVIRIAIYDLLF